MEKRSQPHSIEKRAPLYERALAERVKGVLDRLDSNKRLAETPAYLARTRGEITESVQTILSEIEELEQIGERDYGVLSIPPELAREIGTIWILSGPGTYDEPSKASDVAYQHLSWSHSMDRARLDYGAKLARKITESIEGERYAVQIKNTEADDIVNERIAEKKNEARDSMRTAGPRIIYNGSPRENEVVESVLTRPTTYVPPEKVSVLNSDNPEQPIRNTLDQVHSLVAHKELFTEGKKIAIVSHAPHLVRALRMINKYRPFPEEVEVVVFPLPTPPQGMEEYAAMETEAIFWYSYGSGDATMEPYPHTYTMKP